VTVPVRGERMNRRSLRFTHVSTTVRAAPFSVFLPGSLAAGGDLTREIAVSRALGLGSGRSPESWPGTKTIRLLERFAGDGEPLPGVVTTQHAADAHGRATREEACNLRLNVRLPGSATGVPDPSDWFDIGVICVQAPESIPGARPAPCDRAVPDRRE